MKRILILATTLLVAVSCNKITFDDSVPATPDTAQPVQFGSGAPTVEITKANIALGDGSNGTLKMDRIGIFAFRSATVPATATAAATALWHNSSNDKTANVSYHFFDDQQNQPTSKYYREEQQSGKSPLLFWPASGTANAELTFLGYFPWVASATASAPGMPAAPNQRAYVDNTTFQLKADLSDQTIQTGKTEVYDYGFAWATPLLNVARPADPANNRQKLIFSYKVAKITLVVKGEDEDGLQVSAGGAKDKGLKAIKIYSKTGGLCSDFTLDLLKGVVATGSTAATDTTPIKIQPVNNPGDPTATVPIKPYIDAIGYLVPVTGTDLNTDSDPAKNGIVIEVVHNDGNKDQSYFANINSTTVTNPSTGGKPDLTGGIEAGKNYKYTVKFGKNGLTFTGQVEDWVDADAIPDIDLDDLL